MSYAGDRTTGFASPAADCVEGPIDLAAVLDLRQPSRYPIRVRGSSFVSRGIMDGDVLIADTAGQHSHGQLVIACANGQMLIAELRTVKGKWYLVSGNDAQSPLLVDPAKDVDVWATVTGVVREHP